MRLVSKEFTREYEITGYKTDDRSEYSEHWAGPDILILEIMCRLVMDRIRANHPEFWESSEGKVLNDKERYVP